MLVLTRRLGESIVIGSGIKLTVVSVGPGRVKIGIEAPPHVRIDREEVHARIQQEQASDVLAAVQATAAGTPADQATIIVSGPETNVLSDRAAHTLPPAGPTATTTPGLSKYRSPRKPR
jgi:carbon storage regulator